MRQVTLMTNEHNNHQASRASPYFCETWLANSVASSMFGKVSLSTRLHDKIPCPLDSTLYAARP